MADQAPEPKKKRRRIQKDYNQLFADQLVANGLLSKADNSGVKGWVREYQFHPVRRWAFDFAFPAIRLAVEIEGGVWNGTGHTKPTRFMSDIEKYNTAALMGWKLLRYSTGQVQRRIAINQVVQCLRAYPETTITSFYGGSDVDTH